MSRFDRRKLFLQKWKTQQAIIIWDQCCHLQANGAQLLTYKKINTLENIFVTKGVFVFCKTEAGGVKIEKIRFSLKPILSFRSRFKKQSWYFFSFVLLFRLKAKQKNWQIVFRNTNVPATWAQQVAVASGQVRNENPEVVSPILLLDGPRPDTTKLLEWIIPTLLAVILSIKLTRNLASSAPWSASSFVILNLKERYKFW